jgi:hypothetical protein
MRALMKSAKAGHMRPLKNAHFLSFPPNRESITFLNNWIPAFAGMTERAGCG